MATSIPCFRAGEYGANFSLQYSGKDPDFSHAGVPKAKLEKIHSTGDGDFGRLILGENLKTMSSLMDDPEVAGRVDLVYIDPPFATGGIFNCKQQRSAYTDTVVGTEYMEFIRQRLILCRNLMSEVSSIFLHVDERYVFHIKIIMDEVFGQGMFRNMIIRRKCNSKNYTKKRLGNILDYILWYSKTKRHVWNPPHSPLTAEFIQREYPYVEATTGRRYKRVPLHAPGIRRGETGKTWRGLSPPAGKHWQYKPLTMEALDLRGEIYWSKNGNPRRKVYLDEQRGIPLQDLWTDVKDAHNQNCSITGYPTEKNFLLIKRIIEAGSEPSGLVLDFFSGSATVAEAAARTGRRWICIDRAELAIRTSLVRLLQGRRLMGNYVLDPFEEQGFRGGPIPHGWSMWADLEDTGFGTARELKREVKEWLDSSPRNGSTFSYPSTLASGE